MFTEDVVRTLRILALATYAVLGLTLVLRLTGYGAWVTEPVLHIYQTVLLAAYGVIADAIRGAMTLLVVFGSFILIRRAVADVVGIIRSAFRARRVRTH